MKANHRLAAAPGITQICKGVTGDNKRIVSITGDAACCPYATAEPTGAPRRHVGRIIQRHPNHPAAIQATITKVAAVRYIKIVPHNSQRTTFTLHRRGKCRVVIRGGRTHIHRPPGINGSGVQIERKNQMFDGCATIGCRHGIQKKRARAQIDNRRASDPHRVDVAALEIHQRHRGANVSLPDDAAVYSVQRINVVGFSCRYDRRPAAGAIINVERLGINIACDGSVETQIPCQVTCCALRERGINIKTITRIVIVMLGYVYLRICRLNIAYNNKTQRRKNDPGTRLMLAVWCSHGAASPCWWKRARNAPRHSEAATQGGNNQR